MIPSCVDRVISAEIPDPNHDPDLYALVMTHMVHGPCGALNPSAPCMKDGVCTKKYPFSFQPTTNLTEGSFAVLRRRSPDQGGLTAEKQVTRGGLTYTIVIDNRWIVPYSPFLLRQFQCHLNVEICSTVTSIKYVLKYTFKGPDRAAFNLESQSGSPVDEISDYKNHRYLGSCEAATTLLGLDRNGNKPVVITLKLHLENQQEVYYNPNRTNAASLAQNPPKRTKLEAFFILCQLDSFACTILYHAVPEYFTWDDKAHTWNRRKVGGVRLFQPDGSIVVRSETIGRLPMVSPKQGELYYLRLLLVNVVGPISFNSLKVLPCGTICTTYKDACSRRGLLDDDDHLHSAMDELSQTSTSSRLRDFFVTSIICCEPTHPSVLLNTFIESLCEDFIQDRRRLLGDQTLGALVFHILALTIFFFFQSSIKFMVQKYNYAPRLNPSCTCF